MNKKILIVFVLIIAMSILSGCSQKTTQVDNKENNINTNKSADKVQLFLFYATQRCSSCIAIGKFSKETVETYFPQELESGKIEFREINIDLPENKELAEKFQASGSALFINSIYDGKDNIQQDLAVWKLVSNGNQFKTYLKDKLNNILGK